MGNIVAVGLPVVGAIVSGLLVFLPEYSRTTFSLAEQLIMCGGAFIGIAVTEVLLVAKKMLGLRVGEYRTWVVRDRVDGLLRDIRGSFTKVHADRYGEDDLFVAHFERALTDLARNIARAADHKELQVWNHHFGSVRRVMNVFAGEKEPAYWCTWWLGMDEGLFEDSHWRSYFSQVVEMVRRDAIEEMKILLIVQHLDQVDGDKVGALAGFCGTNRGLECGVVVGGEYSKFRQDAELPASDVDFGIYGTRLLFRTASEEEKSGLFCKDPQMISRYREHFEAVWEHPDTRRDLVGRLDVTSWKELLAADGRGS